MRSNQNRVKFWRDHEEAFRSSGMTRKAYCQKHGLSVYQFDYWRRRLKKLAADETIDGGKDWIPLQIYEEPAGKQNTGIRIRIGSMTVEVEPGFDHKLLFEVLRIAGALC